MPTSDELLMQMIRTAIQENREPRRVASIDLDPEAVLERFKIGISEAIVFDVKAFPVVPEETPGCR